MKYATLAAWLKLAMLGLLACLPMSCSLTDHRLPPPTPASCRLTSINGLAYVYTPGGLLASRGTEQYIYDEDGFVRTQLTYDNGKPFARTTYQYSQGRLVSDEEYRYATNRTLSTKTYEYDSSGQLTRLVEKFTGGALLYTYTYLFSDGQQIDYTEYYSNVGTLTHPYQFGNGLIRQHTYLALSGGTPSVTDYTYDAAGRLTGEANVGAGIYHVYEYVAGRPAAAALPAFKGWPVVVLNARGLLGSSLPSKDITYRTDARGQRYKADETVHTYVQTSTGYPLRDLLEARSYDVTGQLLGQALPQETIYTYDSCP